MNSLKDVLSAKDLIRGRVRGYDVSFGFGFGGPRQLFPRNERWTPVTCWQRNLVGYEWGALVGRQLTAGGTAYRVNAMYLEFENVASPGDTVAVPSLDRTRSVEYYNNLADSSNRDYLRVPMTAHQFESSDVDLFPKGNQPIFFARSQGVEGVHGKPFSNANNSVIFGASLVAMPVEGDHSQDLIFSSTYFDTDNQQPKLSTSQVGLEWELTLE